MQHLINTHLSLVNGLNGPHWLADREAQVHSHHLAGSEVLKTWPVGATDYTLVAVLGLVLVAPMAQCGGATYWHNNIERDSGPDSATRLYTRTQPCYHSHPVSICHFYAVFYWFPPQPISQIRQNQYLWRTFGSAPVAKISIFHVP